MNLSRNKLTLSECHKLYGYLVQAMSSNNTSNNNQKNTSEAEIHFSPNSNNSSNGDMNSNRFCFKPSSLQVVNEQESVQLDMLQTKLESLLSNQLVPTTSSVNQPVLVLP